MRKSCAFLLCLVFCVALCLPLTACHGSLGLNAFAIPETLNEEKPYEIVFWAKNDTNKRQVAVYQKAIEDFQSLYPNVHINLRLYTDYGKIYNDVITNIATQTTPHICITYPDHIATYMTGSHTVVPLDELMQDEKYGLAGSALRFDGPAKDEIIPQFLQEGVLQQVQYALPFMRSTEALYINKTFVEKLGYEVPEVVSWDFVWEVSRAATKKNTDGTFALNGQNVMIPFIYKSTDNMMIQQLRQKNAGYASKDGEIALFNDTTKELLRTIASAAKEQTFSTFKISSYPGNFLNAGQCVFAIDSTAGATWMGTDAPLSDISPDKAVRFETAVRMIPQFDPEHKQMISQGPSMCIFNKKDPQEVLYSWLFIQYLLTNEVQLGYAKTEGYVPVTKKAQQSKEYLDYLSRSGEDHDVHYEVKLKASKLLADNIANTFVTPVFNGSASLRDAAGQLIENTVKSVRRKETVDEAYMDKLFTDVSALYRLDSHTNGQERGQEKDLGPLPKEAKVLLISLVSVWGILLVYVTLRAMKNRRNMKSTV